MNFIFRKQVRGFTLVEVVFSAAIFAVLAASIFQGFFTVMSLITASRDKITAIDLINSEFELVRNLSYSNVGLKDGVPSGVLLATSTEVIDGREFNITRTIRNVDDPFDGTIGGNPNDLSPADYKMVQIEVFCEKCKKPVDVFATAIISPKNLETNSTNGALFIKVFNANGEPVPQANVYIQKLNSNIVINDETNNNGLLAVIDIPPDQNAYRIIVTKDGYTTDRTYATSSSNPYPIKPDATVLSQQVTQVSFVIDKVSTINVSSRNLECAFIPNVPFHIEGSKLIGLNPDVLKYSNDFSTDSSGFKILNNIEWDTFNITPGDGFSLIGINPASPFSVLPDSIKNVDMIFGVSRPHDLLVVVKDSTTNLPLSDVVLTISQGIFNDTKITGMGYFSQTDWSSGAGQENFYNESKYWEDNGGIETTSSGEIKLAKNLGRYVSSGILTSSIFDTGTTTNFSNIIWKPTDQPPQSGENSVRFQIATSETNTSTTTWDFIGPDGSDATFYTLSNNNINPIHNGDRYLRYRVFLSTASDNKTPNISDIAVTFTSGCVPPGQAIFNYLSPGNHDLLLEKNGYQTQIYPVNIITNKDWQSVEASLSPE